MRLAGHEGAGKLLMGVPAGLECGLGKAETKESTATGRIAARNLPVVILDHAVRGAESKTGSFADWFGRIEGVEDASRFGDSWTRVGEFDNDVVVLNLNSDAESAAATFLHRVHGVGDDFEKTLQQLVRVPQN